MRNNRADYFNRKGMTLVELSIAVALSALLLSALVGVLNGINGQVRLSERFERPQWQTKAMEIIRRDLLSAESIWRADGTTWMRSSPPSYFTENVGTRVVGYRCIQRGDSAGMFVRIDGNSANVLGLGANRLVIERLDASGVPQPLPVAEGPVPNQVRVWLFPAGDQTEFVADLVVR